MRAGILLSVREKATRLPGKVLLPLLDGNVTEFLIRRLRRTRCSTVVVATSTDPRDEVLCRIAAAEGVPAFRGSLDDKMLRYRDAVRMHGLDFAVIVDGDDPFISVEHIDRLIDFAAAQPDGKPVDLVVFDNLPLGATGFGIRADALERMCAEHPERNTEVWGHLFRSDPRYRCVDLSEQDPRWCRPDVRMTLDFPEDYTFFRTVAEGLAREGRYPSFPDVMDYIARHPAVTEINSGVQEAYEAHLRASMAASTNHGV